jgi:hypothetical protein
MMILPLLLSLAGPAVAIKADDPPVRVQLNHEQFTRGDRARVYVETVQDGHLVVLHADPDGRVRVLFPLDPSDDDFVRGGKRFELRGRSDRDAFLVDDGDGSGTVVAVFSPDPFSYDAFVRNEHWDYRAFGGGTTELRDDPLAGLLDIARRMAGETHFEYDAVTYVVGGEIASRYGSGYYGSDYYGSGYYGYGHRSRFGVGLSFGYPGYYPWGYDPFCYDPFWGWSCGSRFGGFGYSAYYLGRPYSYRPYAYTRFGGVGRGFTGGSRFVIPRDRVSVAGIQPRSRAGVANPGPTARGSRAVTPRSVQPRGRGPAVAPRGGSSRGTSMAPPGGSSRGSSMAPRGGSSRGSSMSPRGGSSRGPSVSRPSNGGSRGRSQPSGGGGGGTRGGGSRSSGGGGRRH